MAKIVGSMRKVFWPKIGKINYKKIVYEFKHRCVVEGVVIVCCITRYEIFLDKKKNY